jgi:choline dehydrogenase-like flavoprotein
MESPKVLMHSGIGPADQLAKFNIPVLHENAMVGRECSDHVSIMLRFQRAEHTSEAPAFYRNKAAQMAALHDWELFRTGPYASLGCSIALGFFKSYAVLKSDEYAALSTEERMHIAAPTVPTYEVILGATAPDSVTTALIVLHNLQSRGTFTLQSSDPAVPLRFDTDYLSHPYDQRLAIESMRETMGITHSEAFLEDNIAFIDEPKSDSDEDILEFWRENGGTTWHMSGTCRMGKYETPDRAVVDTSFRVFGVQRLRVADMSIMPFLPSSHTQTYAYLIGVVAAEKLIE